MSIREEGQFKVQDFFLNTGGLNSADSPFIVEEGQATDGFNFDYLLRGGVQKRQGHLRLNQTPDSNLISLGLGLYNSPNASRAVIRAAGRKLQNFDFDTFTFTNLTSDTSAAGSDFLASSTTVPINFSMFNTTGSNVLWCAGGGLTNLVGAYSGTKVTTNGIAAPVKGTFAGVGSTSGGTLTQGTYTYTLTYRKASTQVESNAMLASSEATGNVSTGSTGSVALSWTLTGIDTTLVDKINIYRSQVSSTGGQGGFTAGVLVAQVASTTTTFTDVGNFLDGSAIIPRPGNEDLDNSQLPVGVYQSVVNWKQRLVTASGSTLYISDVIKSESWPLTNVFQVPSGGAITGLAIVSLVSGVSGSTIDEALVVFKDREIWAVTGQDFSTWQLTFIDTAGCPSQRLVVNTDGFIAWVNYRGVFTWNGSGKPHYMSQPIEDKFANGGDIDKSQLLNGFGVYCQARRQVQWYLSSLTYGIQKYVVKLDMRLTMQEAQASLTGQITKGVFSPDVLTYPAYSGLVFTESDDAIQELTYLGDNLGYIYSAYSGVADGVSTEIEFEYATSNLVFGTPGMRKRINKVVAWVLDSGTPNLSLDYWANFAFADSDASTVTRTVSGSPATLGLWDQSIWDQSTWDAATGKIIPIQFNLNTQTKNNAEGTSIRLRFRESDSTATLLIYGFSVYFTEVGTNF